MVKEFRWPLELAAGCGFERGTVLDDGMGCGGLLLALLRGCGDVVYYVYYCVCCSCVVSGV
jgi:hypothetical protein